MSYSIQNPTSYKVIGSIHFGNNDWRYLCEPEQWAAEQGATYRWISFTKYPFSIVDGQVQRNPVFGTGLLKLKAGAKRAFHYMGDDEQWLLDTLNAKEVHMYDAPMFVGLQHLYFSDSFGTLPEIVQGHIRTELDKEVLERRAARK